MHGIFLKTSQCKTIGNSNCMFVMFWQCLNPHSPRTPSKYEKIYFSIRGTSNLPIKNSKLFSTETYIGSQQESLQYFQPSLYPSAVRCRASRKNKIIIIDVSLSGLSFFFKKIRDGSGMVDKQRLGHTTKVTPEIHAMVDGKLNQNNELTALDLHRLFFGNWQHNLANSTQKCTKTAWMGLEKNLVFFVSKFVLQTGQNSLSLHNSV